MRKRIKTSQKVDINKVGAETLNSFDNKKATGKLRLSILDGKVNHLDKQIQTVQTIQQCGFHKALEMLYKYYEKDGLNPFIEKDTDIKNAERWKNICAEWKQNSLSSNQL
jgi:hypothetical protein